MVHRRNGCAMHSWRTCVKLIYDKIAEDPRFGELVRRRNRFSIILSCIVLSVYIAFVAVAVFNPALFSMPISGGSSWALGLIGGFVIQMFAFLMTGIYTARANGEFDALAKDVKEAAQ
ncbi:MAG: DUF485 domain-containing protein [Shinella sp.]|nr:MAG: DUF485 domain-containing protein [Shinella sp.]